MKGEATRQGFDRDYVRIQPDAGSGPIEHEWPDNLVVLGRETVGKSANQFMSQLERLHHIPDVADNLDAIQDTGLKLIRKYKIEPEFFAPSRGRALLFSALSLRYSRLDETNQKDAEGEKHFLDYCLKNLGSSFSQRLKKENPNTFPNTELGQKIIDRYTDENLTQELNWHIDSQGVFDQVKGVMGINSKNEMPYEVRVLSIDSGAGTDFMFGSGYSGIDKDLLTKEQIENRRDLDFYRRGLQKRNSDMQSLLKFNLGSYLAFTSGITGKRGIYVPMPLAEKTLYPTEVLDDTGLQIHGTSKLPRDSVLKHEYIHTQWEVQEGYLGLCMEELRAEYFSTGLDHAVHYWDNVEFFKQFGLLSGISVPKLLDSLPVTKPGQVYEKIAEGIGLDLTLELSALTPLEYAKNYPSVKEIRDYLGGYDGFLQRVHSRLGAKRRQAILTNLRIAAISYSKIGQDTDPKLDDLVDSMIGSSFHALRSHELAYVTDMIESKTLSMSAAKKLASASFNIPEQKE